MGGRRKARRSGHVRGKWQRRHVRCVPPAPAIGGREVTLRLWHWDIPLIEPYQRHSAEFTAKNPRLKVEVEHTAKAQYVDKLVTQVAGGAPPDTIGVSVTGDFNVVQAKGMVREVNSLLKRDKYDLGDYIDVNLRQHQWGGKQIGLPYGWTTIVWFYNQNLFRTHGVKTPYEHWRAGTWTWDTYMDLTQRFGRVGGEVFGTAPLPANSNSMSFPIAWSNNGDIFDAQYTRLLLDQTPALETWDFLYRASLTGAPGRPGRHRHRGGRARSPCGTTGTSGHLLNLQTCQLPLQHRPAPGGAAHQEHVFIGNAPGFAVVTVREPQPGRGVGAADAHRLRPTGCGATSWRPTSSRCARARSLQRTSGGRTPGCPTQTSWPRWPRRATKWRIPPRISNFPDLQMVLGEEFQAAWANRQSVHDAATKAAERATPLLTETEIDK